MPSTTNKRPYTESMSGGDEFDALTGWRRLLCVFKKPGIAKATKRKYSRRLRQKARAMLRRWDGEG